jgi:hypothetical protein
VIVSYCPALQIGVYSCDEINRTTNCNVELFLVQGPHSPIADVGTLSIIAKTLRYDFTLSQNAFILSRTVVASNSYHSKHIGPIITSDSYRFVLVDKCYRVCLLHQHTQQSNPKLFQHQIQVTIKHLNIVRASIVSFVKSCSLFLHIIT